MSRTSKTIAAKAVDSRYRESAEKLAKIVKWPAIGALIGGGALLVGYLVGPSIAEDLGAQAGAGFARGMVEAQEKIAQVRRQLNVAGWGTYRR